MSPVQLYALRAYPNSSAFAKSPKARKLRVRIHHIFHTTFIKQGNLMQCVWEFCGGQIGPVLKTVDTFPGFFLLQTPGHHSFWPYLVGTVHPDDIGRELAVLLHSLSYTATGYPTLPHSFCLYGTQLLDNRALLLKQTESGPECSLEPLQVYLYQLNNNF